MHPDDHALLRRADLPLLVSAGEIAGACERMGAAISEAHAGQRLLVLVVLSGAFMFAADLVRHIELPVEVEFIRVGSYGEGHVSSGKVALLQSPRTPLAGRHVLLVEDIVDSGLSARFLLAHCAEQGAASVALAALLLRDIPAGSAPQPDYVGIRIPDGFVVGYGLDDGGLYRNWPDIRTLPNG